MASTADKPIDHEFQMHALKAGGHYARQKMLELKDELRVFHNQPGSKVVEREKGCFGGAFNAWVTAGEPLHVCTVWLMAVTEAFAVHEIHELIKTEVIDPWDGEMDVLSEGERDRFVAYKMRLGPAEISHEEQQIGQSWCISHAAGGIARYWK
jgi:hypothetical protein